MAEKAKTLSALINAFHPKALTAEQIGFYQPTAAVRYGKDYEYHESLYTRISESDDNLHLLVVGHGGCGKSTELQMLAHKLRGSGTPAMVIAALEDLSLNDFTYIDVFILLIKRIAEYAESEKLQVSKKLLEAFNAALSTNIISKYVGEETALALESGASASVTLPFFLQMMNKFALSLKMGAGVKDELRRDIKPQMKNIAEAANAFIGHINDLLSKKEKTGGMVIIIDGLEKCDKECVRKLFVEDVSSISSIRAHMVLACPISLYRSSDAPILLNNFNSVDVMPMIKTHNPDAEFSPWQPGIVVIRELILMRSEACLFEEGVLERVISVSGGNLRDTCYLLRESAHDARMRKRESIDIASVEYKIGSFASDIFLRVKYEYFPTMKEIYKGNHKHIHNTALLELLYAGAVFEYNGEGWVDLHPLIRYYIDKNPEVLD
jgi:energy-coupling factor transporter ATP-binding protein EcfA2